MLGLVAREWWVFAIRGIAAIAFGILAFIWPETTLTVLVFLFGGYVLVDGVALLVSLVRGDAVARRHAWAVGIMGVLGIVAGVVTFLWPGLTAMSLLYVVAFWAIAMGLFQVVAAVALRRELDGEFWMAIGGLASIVFGALLVAFPSAGLISLVWLVGMWSVVFGVSSLGLAYRLHAIDAALPKPAAGRGGALTRHRRGGAAATPLPRRAHRAMVGERCSMIAATIPSSADRWIRSAGPLPVLGGLVLVLVCGARPPRGGFARRPRPVRTGHRPHRLADGRHARAAWRPALDSPSRPRSWSSSASLLLAACVVALSVGELVVQVPRYENRLGAALADLRDSGRAPPDRRRSRRRQRRSSRRERVFALVGPLASAVSEAGGAHVRPRPHHDLCTRRRGVLPGASDRRLR